MGKETTAAQALCALVWRRSIRSGEPEEEEELRGKKG
jgi:hypothetical protein